MTMSLLGRLLRGVHAGEKDMAWNHPAVAGAPATLTLTSSAFAHGGAMPRRHAGSGVGDDVSPPLAWSAPPPGTKELALVMEDPSAPVPRPFVHLVVYAIAPATTAIPEGAASGAAADAAHDGFAIGANSLRRRRYMGPRPVPGHGPHSYVFQLFAFDRRIQWAKPPTRGDLLQAVHGAVLARGRLDGIYER
jgi:Raf kinase inhibitor-like YbhB/YbcL family protein